MKLAIPVKKNIIGKHKHTDTHVNMQEPKPNYDKNKINPNSNPMHPNTLVQASSKHNQPESQALCKHRQLRKENEKQNGVWNFHS